MASLLDARVQLALRIERFLGAAVGDQLDALEQAAPAHVADKGMIAEALLQPARQMRALRADVGEQIVAADDALHGERRGAGQRMADVGVAVLEDAGAVGDSRRRSCRCTSIAPIGT